MELNANEIIKALECCHIAGKDCLDCPYEDDPSGCVYLEKNTLSLIKELTEENAFLHKTITENAQLALEVTLDEIEKAKADTVRKMHSEIKERCIKGGIYPAFVARVIDQIAEEIIADGKQ